MPPKTPGQEMNRATRRALKSQLTKLLKQAKKKQKYAEARKKESAESALPFKASLV